MPKTLLLADDSVTIQRVIELTFAHEDVRVVSVSDGRRAVQWLEGEWPDIVLADVDVPEVDGYEIAEHVKTSPRLKDVPVVLLAGAFEPVDQDRVEAIGCEGVLVKPFEPQQLIGRVKELLDGHVEQPVGAAAGDRMEFVREQSRREESATVTPFPVPGGPMRVMHGSADPAVAPEPLEPPARPVWELGLPDPIHRPADAPPASATPAASPAAAATAAGSAKVSLVSAFSALLAAEQSTTPASPAAAPVTEATVEDAVRRVLVKMTDELVRRIVVETAERLIREEIEKIKANPE
jgi:CheY-like chemotaxis protein